MNKEIFQALQEGLEKIHEELQERPNQYVVGYFRKSDESLIGYHLSTFCQITQDIFKGKRYAGENPSNQLETIFKNITYALTKEHEGMFSEIHNDIKNNDFKGLSIEDIYIDAIYLSEDMPKQECRFMLIDNKPSKVEIDLETPNYN